MTPTIRVATDGDANDIARLLEQLGYEVHPGDVPSRLRAIDAEGGIALVATDAGNAIVGVTTAARHATLHAGPQVAYITALVTDMHARRSGVGRALVTALEDWAQLHGCLRIAVTSAEHRADAHAFYPRCGFPYTGRRFTKMLSP